MIGKYTNLLINYNILYTLVHKTFKGIKHIYNNPFSVCHTNGHCGESGHSKKRAE